MFYIFIGCLGFGVLYSLVSLFLGHGFGHDFGGHGDFGGNDVAGHADSSSSDMPSPFNPLVLASAITTFGAIGLIASQGFGMGDFISTMVALAFAGAVGAVIFFGVVKLMYSSQSNSIFSLDDLADTEAEVLTPIPEQGIGEIAYVANGERNNMPARSSDKIGIERGTTVIIRKVAGNIAFVQRKLTLDDLDMYGLQEDRQGDSRDNKIKL